MHKMRKEQDLEEKINKASKVQLNLLEEFLGITLVISPSTLFMGHDLSLGYDLIVTAVGLSLMYHGTESIYKKVKYLKETCGSLLKNNYSSE